MRRKPNQPLVPEETQERGIFTFTIRHLLMATALVAMGLAGLRFASEDGLLWLCLNPIRLTVSVVSAACIGFGIGLLAGRWGWVAGGILGLLVHWAVIRYLLEA